MINRIWEYRQKNKMTLKVLSMKTGISVAELSNLENDKTNDILLSNAIILADVFQTDLYDLFCINNLSRRKHL